MAGDDREAQHLLINHVHPIKTRHGKALSHDVCIVMEQKFSSDSESCTVLPTVSTLILTDLDYSEDFVHYCEQCTDHLNGEIWLNILFT